jgi:hypothetical protein
MIENYLNIKNSTRRLTDRQFDNILPQLAKELSDISFYPNHSDEVLQKNWKELCKYVIDSDFTNSRVTTGMKLCEHFFPNFYDIENTKGLTFKGLWKDINNLEKILRWNRKSHSYPYLSELKRGIYFCGLGLAKSTMFRPHLAKMICDAKDGEYVLDPCAGWGGRMLGAVASGKGYVGFEPNDETYNNLNELVNYLKLPNVILYNDVAENMNKYDFPNPDIILTSPPYYNLEIYSDKGSENDYDNYESWREGWLKDVILKSLGHLNRGGWSCWNVHNIGKMKLIDDVRDIHERNSFNEVREFGLQSSKRQSNGCQKTNLDVTKVYQS